MHEIAGSTAVNNHFVDGSSTQSGTIVSADWLNTVQDEICNLITSVGIPLNSATSDDRKQLVAAVTKLIANSVASFVTQTEFGNVVEKLNTLVDKTDFATLMSRVAWCEDEIKIIIGKVEKL